ncbi:hypothetical protein V2J09_016908 [Rumex salicifolius]
MTSPPPTPEVVLETQENEDLMVVEPKSTVVEANQAVAMVEVQSTPKQPDIPKLWTKFVGFEDKEKTVLSEEFLANKINICFPEGDLSEPIVTIAADVIATLASVWSSSSVIKVMGTRVPYDIMYRKLKELWKPKGRMKLNDLPNWYFLDYITALTGDPSTVFGHYMVIKQWSPSFCPTNDVIATTPAWIRTHSHELANAVGSPVKVSERTVYAQRGCFARVCIELDLTKSLKGAVIINGSRVLVESEGLEAIFFKCGRFSHFQPSCTLDPKNIAKREAMENARAIQTSEVE